MNRFSLKKFTYISTAFLAITFSSAYGGSLKHNDNESVTNTNSVSAEQYWSEFKQDSKQTWKDTKTAFRDGWVEGKLETALVLNEHLNPFKIDIHVDGSEAYLSGEVSSEVEKELAENIALGIAGIDSVQNNLDVNDHPKSKMKDVNKREFSQYFSDVSKTATIKSELLASTNVSGTSINVDTFNNQVTLTGTVKSEEEKDLAEAIVAKHKDVGKIVNKLEVKS